MAKVSSPVRLQKAPSPIVRRDAQEALSRAVWFTRHKKYIPALDLFEENLDLGEPDDSPSRQRFMSFYGLCVAMVWGEAERAKAMCETALRTCHREANLYFNVGMVYLRQRRREEALLAFREGLKIDPTHAELRASMERLRPRQRAIFPFLERQHPLNKYSGMVRNRVTRILSRDRSLDLP